MNTAARAALRGWRALHAERMSRFSDDFRKQYGGDLNEFESLYTWIEGAATYVENHFLFDRNQPQYFRSLGLHLGLLLDRADPEIPRYGFGVG